MRSGFVAGNIRTIFQRLCGLAGMFGDRWKRTDASEHKVLNCVVSYNEYGGYCVPVSSSHRPAAQRILSNKIHEPKTIEFIVSQCGNGDVVHAGTYFGDFLPALSNGLAPDAKVWAFEPNPESFRCAEITIQINEVNNVVLTNAGLGEKHEQLRMVTEDDNGVSLGGGSKIIPQGERPTSKVEIIDVVTIDEIVSYDRSVSVIQLDVEGHEKAALTGAINTIRRCLPIIILEVWPSSTLHDSDWFKENILSLGYKNIGRVHSNSIYSCKHT